MLGKRLIKSNDAGGGACTNTVDLYNPFPDGGGVALYQLNGDATDVSGNYNGTATNVTYGTGVFGQAGVFNGSSSKITTSLTQTNTNAWSWSFWVNINAKPSAGNIAAILSNINGAAPFAGVTFLIDSPNFGIASNGSNIWTANTINPSLSTWYHIVITYNGSGGITPYINGQSYGVISHTPSNGNTITLGDSDVSSWGSFNGSIDQVRIFSRALRPYEVEALYTEEYCTPTIVPSEHFNTVTYTGNEISGRQITGVGFQPDFTWIKDRGDGTHWHNLFDSVRGASQRLFSNTINAESFYNESLQSFDADGFTVGFDPDVNRSGGGIVAWNFKAGGAAVTNTDGTITSQVSANTEAGFSIVSWTGTTTTSDTIGHGLSEVPTIVLMKNRTSTSDWFYYTTQIDGSYDYLRFNSTNAKANSSRNAPTNNFFDQSTMAGAIGSGDECIAYCFAEVEGFSNFGSYVGNGSTSGPTVITGFEPAFLLIKQSSASGEYWNIWDNKRSPENPRSDVLFPNLSNAESSNQSWSDVQFLENGFQVTPTVMTPTNQSGATYIYMAFAADPTAVEPTLEDSFNTVLWTGDGTSNRAITGVGFQPDFIWTKCRSLDWNNVLADSVRGFSTVDGDVKYLASDITNGEFERDGLRSFDSDGFTIDTYPNVNDNNQTFVAWNWKGAEIPAINSNGSIPSVVSANPAAGFSIVSYTGNGVSGSTIGHGLNSDLDMFVVKRRDGPANWAVYHSSVGVNHTLQLDTTSAQISVSGKYSGTNSSVFGVNSASDVNFNNSNYIAYCFAEVAGFSKFGSYVGTGAAGQKITTNFEPAFVMLKKTSSAGAWVMLDNKRDTLNPNTARLYANAADAETNPSFGINILSDGFDFNAGSYNDSGGTYIYMAFANQF